MGLDQGWLLRMVERYSMLEEEKVEKEFLFQMKLDTKDSKNLFLRDLKSPYWGFFFVHTFIESRFV